MLDMVENFSFATEKSHQVDNAPFVVKSQFGSELPSARDCLPFPETGINFDELEEVLETGNGSN